MISNQWFFRIVVAWLVAWALLELIRFDQVPQWTCIDGIGEAAYTYVGLEPPHMDCRRQ
jgi:hypothetical protein